MFRIWIYLSIKTFLTFKSSKKIAERKKFIEYYIQKQSKKKVFYLVNVE